LPGIPDPETNSYLKVPVSGFVSGSGFNSGSVSGPISGSSFAGRSVGSTAVLSVFAFKTGLLESTRSLPSLRNLHQPHPFPDVPEPATVKINFR